SSLLVLSMLWLARRQMAADPPGDLHVRLLGGEGEAAVFEPSGYPCIAGRLEVAQLVLERWLERRGLGGQPDRRVAAAVGPHLAVVGGRVRRRWMGRARHAATLAG